MVQRLVAGKCRYIKCIITTSYVLVLDAKQPAVKAFVQQLQQRIKEGFALNVSHGAVDRGITVLSLHRLSKGGPPFELKPLEAALDEVRHMSAESQTVVLTVTKHEMPIG